MVQKPVVFISSTSDLRSARDLVGKVLYSMGYEPVWQEVEATDGGELLTVLRRRIAPCSLLIQLVGQRYGAEAPTSSAEFGRVSYTQFEALYAEKLGIKVIYHFLDPAFPADVKSPEQEDRQELQGAYRQRIESANELRHTHIVTAQDLELSIRRISDELAAVRKQSERRFRKMLWMVGGSAVGVSILAALVIEVLHRQSKSDVQVAALRIEIRAAIAPQTLAQGQTIPDALPAALIEKAKLLLERGDVEDQALAKIALKQHEGANRIIQELKSKPGNPIDEAFRFLTLEGDNWYKSGAPDKSIEPYEQAMALRPNDIAARKNLAFAHTFTRQGTKATHLQRAIEICEGTLKRVAPGSVDWANAQRYLGNALNELRTGDRGANVQRAIGCYQAALTIHTKDADPDVWASTQNGLGIAWRNMPGGGQDKNLRKAIDYYLSALTVHTKETAPTDWAMVQNNLGNALDELPTGDHDENGRKAIECYEAALTVITKETDLYWWASLQFNLGNTWKGIATGDRSENMLKAIDCYRAALTVRTREASPDDWAVTQKNLGNVWDDLPTGNREENVRNAIACYEAALSVRTKDSAPTDWATIQNNLGVVWTHLPTGDKGDNIRNAIACYLSALSIYAKDTAPVDWARTQNNLGGAWKDLPTGDRQENVRKAIACYEAALTVRTKEASPADRAATQNNLGIAWDDLSIGDRDGNIRKAIGCYEAALSVYEKDTSPLSWAMAQNNLGVSWRHLRTGDRSQNVRKAIECYDAALTVRTKAYTPNDWAMTQGNLAMAWHDLPVGDWRENLRKAIDCNGAALTVYTLDANPGKAVALRINMSWWQLLTGDFQGALATTVAAENVKPKNLALETNHAHALLFLDRWDEANAIYLKYMDKNMTSGSWQDVILQDFDQLERIGLTHPRMKTIREEFDVKSTSKVKP